MKKTKGLGIISLLLASGLLAIFPYSQSAFAVSPNVLQTGHNISVGSPCTVGPCQKDVIFPHFNGVGNLIIVEAFQMGYDNTGGCNSGDTITFSDNESNIYNVLGSGCNSNGLHLHGSGTVAYTSTNNLHGITVHANWTCHSVGGAPLACYYSVSLYEIKPLTSPITATIGFADAGLSNSMSSVPPLTFNKPAIILFDLACYGSCNSMGVPSGFTGSSTPFGYSAMGAYATNATQISPDSVTFTGLGSNQMDIDSAIYTGQQVSATGRINNLDCGNCMIANGKYYQFFNNATSHASTPPIGYLAIEYGSVPNGAHTPRIQHLIALAQQYPAIRITAVMNNGGGAGGAQDANFVAAINGMRAVGIIVLGYVFDCQTNCFADPANRKMVGSDTNFPPYNRGIQQEIDAWHSFYALDGIFFDNAIPGTGDTNLGNPASGWPGHTVLQYYQNQVNYGVSNYGYTFTMSNVGTVVPNMIGVGDVLNLEDLAGSLPSASTLHSWTTAVGGIAEDYSLIATNIVSAPTVSYLDSVRNYISWIFPTDVTYGNEPSYQNVTFANLNQLHSAFGNSPSIKQVNFQFFDGAGNNITFGYDNSTGRTNVYSGAGFIDLGVAQTSSHRLASGAPELLVTIPVALRTTIQDIGASTITVWVKLTSGANSGWLILQSGITIINQGGATVRRYSGNASSVAGEDNFACLAGYTGSCSANSTYIGLQHYSTQYSISLLPYNYSYAHSKGTAIDKLSGLNYLWQDYNHANCSPCGEAYTWPGAWSIKIHWWAWNNQTKSWFDTQMVNISMAFGDQGASDEWTTMNVQWYKQLIGVGCCPLVLAPYALQLVKTDSTTAWMEQGSGTTNPGAVEGQVRLFVDMWLTNDNASTLHGGRVGVMWTGMHNSGFLLWSSWSPTFDNQTESFSKSGNTGVKFTESGTPLIGQLSAQTMLCSKIQFTVSRQIGQPYVFSGGHPFYQVPIDKYFSIFVHNFAIAKFTKSSDIARDGGVATPQFTTAQVPNLPATGFLSALAALLEPLAAGIWGVIANALNQLWLGIGTQFPWFTAFWGDVYSAILSFSALFFSVFPILTNGLTYVLSLFSFVLIPIQVIQTIAGSLSPYFSWLPFNVVAPFTEIVILMFFSVRYLVALNEGNIGLIYDDARKTWAIANAIMFWTYKFARAIIDSIVGLIP